MLQQLLNRLGSKFYAYFNTAKKQKASDEYMHKKFNGNREDEKKIVRN